MGGEREEGKGRGGRGKGSELVGLCLSPPKVKFLVTSLELNKRPCGSVDSDSWLTSAMSLTGGQQKTIAPLERLILVEKDLGVYIVNNLKPSLQCATASNEAMSVMRLIKRQFKSIDLRRIQLTDKAYIRLHLEYRIQVWSPY